MRLGQISGRCACKTWKFYCAPSFDGDLGCGLGAQMDMKRVRGLVEQKTGNTPNNYLNELVYLKQRFNYATSSLQDEDEGCVRS